MLPEKHTTSSSEFVKELKQSLIEYELALCHKDQFDLDGLLKKIEKQKSRLQKQQDFPDRLKYLEALLQNEQFIQQLLPHVRYTK